MTHFFKGTANPFYRLVCATGLFLFIQGVHSQNHEFDWARQAGGPGGDLGASVAVDGSGNCVVTGWFSGTAVFGPTTLTSAGDLDIFIVKIDHSGNFLWAKRAGGPGADRGQGIAVDGSGNVFVTGAFSGTAAFGSTPLTSAGDQDVFVVKLSASGNFLWAGRAGGPYLENGQGIAVDGSGNAIIIGNFYGGILVGSTALTSTHAGDAGFSLDIFIAKLDASGNFLWARQAGGPKEDFGLGIAVDGSGNALVTGNFSGIATFGSTTLLGFGGASDIFVSKLDPSGNFVWAIRAGGFDSDGGFRIAADGPGNAYVTGFFDGTTTIGSTSLTGIRINDMFIAKLNASGTFVWAKRAGGSNDTDSQGIAIDASGNVFVTGYFMTATTLGSTSFNSAGSSDVFIAKLDASGTFL
jgi:hypothetical protein